MKARVECGSQLPSDDISSSVAPLSRVRRSITCWCLVEIAFGIAVFSVDDLDFVLLVMVVLRIGAAFRRSHHPEPRWPTSRGNVQAYVLQFTANSNAQNVWEVEWNFAFPSRVSNLSKAALFDTPERHLLGALQGIADVPDGKRICQFRAPTRSLRSFACKPEACHSTRCARCGLPQRATLARRRFFIVARWSRRRSRV